MSERQKAYTVKPPRISEHQEQVNFLLEVRTRYGLREDFIETLLFATPNGMWAGGSSREGKFALIGKMKKEGFKNGVSDLLYLQPRGDYAYLAIEMKATDKRDDAKAVSPEQAAFLAAVNEAGGTGEVCYGCDEAVAIFTWYMSLPVKSIL